MIRLTLYTLLLLALRASAGVAVIAHAGLGVDSVDQTTLADIYSLDQLVLGDKDLVVFDLNADDATRDAFYAAIGKDHQSMKKLWLRAKLTGSGEPPTAVTTLDEMGQQVAATPGAIGYVDASRIPDGVKVLATFE